MSGLNEVKPGDPLSAIGASGWNRVVRAVRRFEGNRRADGAPPPNLFVPPNTVVYVRNDTGSTLARGAIVMPTGPIFAPSESEDEFYNRFSLAVDVPDADAAGRVGITLGPIEDGKIGKAVFDGLATCLVNVTGVGIIRAREIDGDASKLQTDPDGAIEILWREAGSSGNKVAVVRIGGGLAPATRRPSHLITATTADITGAKPSWVYTLTPVSGFSSGSWSAAGTTVRCRNFAEDQAHYQHGQGFPSGVTGTYLPVSGPVPAWDTGLVEAGVPLWAFDALNPIDPTCGGG